MFLHRVLKRKRRIFQGNPSVVGLTFLEIIISLTLISVGMLLYLEIFNTALDAHSRSIREIISTNLAQGLMAEIMVRRFAEFDGDTNIGPDPVAAPTETRFNPTLTDRFDDVDDYNGYSESPPRTLGNLPMDGLGDPPRPNYSGFTRTVTVIYVDCAATCLPAAGATDYKRVTLRVTDPRGRVTELVEVRVVGP